MKKTNLAASVRQRLLNRSRAQNRPFEELLLFEDARYEGVRVRFIARLGSARVRMQLDIGFGDIVHPAPQQAAYPAMLDFPAPEILGYSRESAIAEKFEAMVQLGELNSRMKDFYDIWLLARQFEFERDTLKTAIERTFGQRGTDIPQPLQFSTGFVDDRQPLWTAFRNRLEQPHVPQRFGEITDALSAFLGPVTDPAPDSKLTHWPAGGPWRERTDG